MAATIFSNSVNFLEVMLNHYGSLIPLSGLGFFANALSRSPSLLNVAFPSCLSIPIVASPHNVLSSSPIISARLIFCGEGCFAFIIP